MLFKCLKNEVFVLGCEFRVLYVRENNAHNIYLVRAMKTLKYTRYYYTAFFPKMNKDFRTKREEGVFTCLKKGRVAITLLQFTRSKVDGRGHDQRRRLRGRPGMTNRMIWGVLLAGGWTILNHFKIGLQNK